jgi:hypothetical protein
MWQPWQRLIDSICSSVDACPSACWMLLTQFHPAGTKLINVGVLDTVRAVSLVIPQADWQLVKQGRSSHWSQQANRMAVWVFAIQGAYRFIFDSTRLRISFEDTVLYNPCTPEHLCPSGAYSIHLGSWQKRRQMYPWIPARGRQRWLRPQNLRQAELGMIDHSILVCYRLFEFHEDSHRVRANTSIQWCGSGPSSVAQYHRIQRCTGFGPSAWNQGLESPKVLDGHLVLAIPSLPTQVQAYHSSVKSPNAL